jgi:ParB family chromosome partitioning protein
MSKHEKTCKSASVPLLFTRLKKVKLSELKTDKALKVRKEFDKERIEELAKSLKRGMLHPIIAVEKNGTLVVVAGYRRLKALERLGVEETYVAVIKGDDKEAFMKAIVENLLRRDLNPIEQAEAFRRAVKVLGMTFGAIARHLGKHRSYVSRRLALLRLHPDVQDWVAHGRLSPDLALKLLTVKDSRQQKLLADDYCGGGLSRQGLLRKIGLAERLRESVKPKESMPHGEFSCFLCGEAKPLKVRKQILECSFCLGCCQWIIENIMVLRREMMKGGS